MPPNPHDGLNRYSRNSGVPFDPAKRTPAIQGMAVSPWIPGVAYSLVNYHLFVYFATFTYLLKFYYISLRQFSFISELAAVARVICNAISLYTLAGKSDIFTKSSGLTLS